MYEAELTNGSIIDLNGLILMFIGKQESGGSFTVPECLLNDLNALKLQCPVQLNNICLQIIDKAMQKKIGLP